MILPSNQPYERKAFDFLVLITNKYLFHWLASFLVDFFF